MNLADVFTVTLVILGFLIVFNCYWLIAEGLFSKIVGRASDRYAARPVQTVLLGAALGLPVFFIGAALSGKGGPLKLVGFIGLSAPLLLGLFGSAGLARRIGEGLISPVDATEPWRRVLRGGIVLSCAFVLPFVGWFVVMPGALASGVGALAGLWLDHRREAALKKAQAATNVPGIAQALPGEAAASEDAAEQGAAA